MISVGIRTRYGPVTDIKYQGKIFFHRSTGTGNFYVPYLYTGIYRYQYLKDRFVGNFVDKFLKPGRTLNFVENIRGKKVGAGTGEKAGTGAAQKWTGSAILLLGTYFDVISTKLAF
jgi:hypothetical protein